MRKSTSRTYLFGTFVNKLNSYKNMAKQNTAAYMKFTAVSLLYLLLCSLFFSHTHAPYKAALPIASLLISALWVSPWQVALGVLSSAIGNILGEKDLFVWQMCSFAVGHLFFIWFFASRFFKMNSVTSIKNILFTTIAVLCICAFSLILIVPETPAGTIRHGATIYTIIISIMLWCALLQKDATYAIGTSLFVVSDLILGWNRFVAPLPYAIYLIMIPYYISQLIIFIRSAHT